MASDLEDIGSKLLPERVRRTQNTYDLVTYIDSGGAINLEIRTLIVAVLSGAVHARYKPPGAREALFYISKSGRKRPTAFVVGLLEHYKRCLENPTELALKSFEATAKRNKFTLLFDTKGQRTTTAKKLLAVHLNLTDSQLNELLSQRSSRIKPR